MTRKESVLKLLRPRRWISTYEIEKAGGIEGMRRLRELRSEGYEIKMRPLKGTNAYEYRLVGTPS